MLDLFYRFQVSSPQNKMCGNKGGMFKKPFESGFMIQPYRYVALTIQNLEWPFHDGSHSTKVYSARWWMASYGSKTPKRHVMYSNSPSIGAFDLGKLRFDYSNPEYQANRTTKVMVKELENGQKQKSFQGVKNKLKDTQHLD